MAAEKNVRSLSASPVPLPPVLLSMLSEGRLPHSVCFESNGSANGISAALTLSAALLCKSPHEDKSPCGECSFCRKIFSGNHCDVTVLDRRIDPDSFKKKALRETRIDAYRKPVEGESKVYIFVDAGSMDASTQNLLLKLIEEPPENTYFIFTCENKYLLLPTILSRVVCISLPPLSENEMLSELQRRAPGFPEEKYKRAVQLCAGDPELGESIMKDSAAEKLCSDAVRMINAWSRHKCYELLTIAVPYEKNRTQYKQLLLYISSLSSRDSIREECGLDLASVIQLRSLIRELIALCDRNGSLSLASALLAGA